MDADEKREKVVNAAVIYFIAVIMASIGAAGHPAQATNRGRRHRGTETVPVLRGRSEDCSTSPMYD
jgi:hypothetical protein